MKNVLALRERYLRDSLPVRLGGLAANLARIQSFSDHPGHGDAVARLVHESKLFIEWTASEADPSVQAVLVDCQRQLVRWHLAWSDIWLSPARRAEVATGAGLWSQRILQVSGLASPSGGPQVAPGPG
jgi:hypothetical protein